MEKILQLKTYVDGVNDTPFPYADSDPIEIGAFRYDAKRMGGAPTITASVNYPSCLDNEWTDKVYAEFNGEKYYLKQTPTSSYNNEDVLYKHDLELVSERFVLDNVYFYDAVSDESAGDDKPVSNSTKVVFFGDIHEFAKRLQSSLAYSGIDYEVYVDSGVSTEGKLISFEDAFFSNVLQEIYNTYEQPYYFNFYTDEEGVRHKEIRIGKTNRVIEREFAYGVDDALLSITKNNANYKVVNRATATGSSDNIPFYYPNNSPKGEIAAVCSNPNATATIIDHELYSNEIEIDGVITKNNIEYENLVVTRNGSEAFSGQSISSSLVYGGIVDRFYATFDAKNTGNLVVSFKTINDDYFISEDVSENSWVSTRISVVLSSPEVVGVTRGDTLFELRNVYSVEDIEIPINKALDGYQLTFEVRKEPMGGYANKWGTFSYNPIFSFGSASGWFYKGKAIDLTDIGLEVSGEEASGDTITQTLIKYVKTSQNLMPSVYRETDGAERFYNATNGLYPFEPEEGYELKSNEYILDGLVHNDNYKNEDGEYIEFNNPYTEGRPKEHIITVEDIKPTIEKTEVNGLRIDMFSEFAYDEDDNDETYEDEEGNVYFKHPYFYGKLRVMDFNLFEHAIEDQPMTISFTSGDVGACNFEIGVTEEYPQKNPVQVYEEDTIIDGVLHEAGSLKRDSEGRVLAGVEGTQQQVTEFQERQQDTSKYEVWIALKKEEETYGILMPQGTFRPKADENGTNEGDTFVILGINLPKVYITNAEKLLEAEIIKYIKDNNDEKFNFSIKFSRIFFAEEENEEIFGALNENAQITVRYNNIPYTLYVSSYSYSMNDGETLPEISVELSESLSVSQNALQNAVSEIKGQIKSFAYATDTAISMQTASYIQKQADDEAHGLVNFTKGIKFGEGGKVEVLDNNSAKLTIEYLEVTKKASFTSLEIQEKTHVGGQMLITPAAINCGEVEEFDDYYRCYFQTKGESGDEIFNQFMVGDQAICQTYNAWGSRYYWRLVVGVGEDYIDLSKEDCDEYSDTPIDGDKIIQLGNRSDKARQAAQVLSSYGENAPSFIMYNGINSFSLNGKEVTGILWNPKTQEPQMYSYGSFFFGDGTTDENGNLIGDNFITFQQRKGDTEKSLSINANVTIGPNSSGLTNLSEWRDKQTQIDTASTNANEAKQVADIANASVVALGETVEGLDKTIEEINHKLDGVVESFFDDYTPSRTNEPAATWIAEGTEANHIGDTFTNTALEGEDAGKSWRWLEQSDGTYDWQQIADSDAAKALALASQAQATADGKSTTFLVKPNRAYGKGDIWIVGEDYIPSGYEVGDILSAIKSSSTYIESHWSKVVRYTDDTAAEEAQSAAAKAQQKAEDAEEVAQNAKNALDGLLEDGLIQKFELQSFQSEYASINADKLTIDADVLRYGLSENAAYTSFSESFTSYNTTLENIIGATSYPIAVPSGLIANRNAYYGTRSDLLKVIAEAAKAVADEAKAAANDAQERAEQAAANAAAAQEKADSAEDIASSAKERIDKLIADAIITRSEADIFAIELRSIVAEKSAIDADVERYVLGSNASYTSYSGAYTNYYNILSTITNATEFPISAPDELVPYRNAYYGSRTSILNDIAAAAKRVADDAQDAADEANGTLSDWLSDGVITPVEKQALRNELARINEEYATIIADAVRYELDRQAYYDYEYVYPYYRDELERIIEAEGTQDGTTLSTYQSEYYEEKKELLERIESAAKSVVDGMTYLTETFGNGNNLNVSGAVLSQMVAVSNSAGEIEAFINGSDVGKDSQHGKLLIAAGVSDISDPSTAATKIYEDGRIEVDAPTVNGKVIISDDGFTYYDTSGSEKKLRASMGGTCAGASGMFVAHDASGPVFCTDAAILAIGGDSTPAANFHGEVVVSGVLDARNQGLWCNKIESPLVGTIEIALPEDESLTRTIRIPYGMIEGLRPKTRVLNNTANSSSPHILTHLDHSVFVNISSGTCYMALPSAPQDGQEYYIESRGGNMNIKLTGKSGYSMYSGTTLAANTSVTQTGRALLRFKFYSDANLWVISWLNRDNA